MENMEQKVCADLPFFVAGVNASDLPVEVIELIESIVHADRRRILDEHSEEVSTLSKAFADYRVQAEQQIEESKAEFIVLEKEYDTCARELKEQQVETMRIIEERNEARQNRDNAAQQIEELKAEVRRLEEQVAEYQKAKVFGEREAQQIIDITPTETDSIQSKIDAVRKLYTKTEDWGSVIKAEKQDGTFELVGRDELEREWSPITPPSLGGSEDTVTFLGQDQAITEEGPILVAEVGDFRGQAEVPPAYTECGLGGDTVDEGVEEAPVTRKEFDELKAAVDILYVRQTAIENNLVA